MPDPNAGIIKILRGILPWVRLISIVGFIAVATFAILGVVSLVGKPIDRVEHIPYQTVIVYATLAVLSLIPSIYLHKCARRMETFMAQGHIIQLESMLEAQRGYWKFLGILVLTAGAILMAAMLFGVLASI